MEERLSSLAALHAQGKLSDDEFRAAKAKTLHEP
ncbi:MAG TPA: SHOCT domain-containing protein [Candidatus Thermoplasmatota archaeon]|nr:SHOCT domain-containing protein [Candidatus Thermoplasmatota archaeon]